jgi:hypothetical protein
MLSESERQMILQHRELELQRQQSPKSGRKPSFSHSTAEKERIPATQSGYWGWKNVALELESSIPAEKRSGDHEIGMQRVHSMRTERTAKRRSGPLRTRSKTNPERIGTRTMPHRRLEGSLDCSNKFPVSTRPSFGRTGQISYERMGRNGKSSMRRDEGLWERCAT